MVNKDILKYLQEGKKRGFSVDVLKKKLKENGFEDGEIAEAVKALPPEKPAMGKVMVGKGNAMVQKQQQMKKPELGKERMTNSVEPRLGIFAKVGKALGHPVDLFNRTRGEGIWPSIKYTWAVSVAPLILLSLVSFLVISFLISIIPQELIDSLGQNAREMILAGGFAIFLVSFLVLLVGLFILAPICLFITSGITHLAVKLYKGTGDYGDTFKALAYSRTPNLLLMFLFPLTPLWSIWSLILAVVGIAKYHDMSGGKAFLALITIPVILIILGLIVRIIVG